MKKLPQLTNYFRGDEISLAEAEEFENDINNYYNKQLEDKDDEIASLRAELEESEKLIADLGKELEKINE